MPRDATRRGDECVVVVAVASARTGSSTVSEVTGTLRLALVLGVAGSSALTPCLALVLDVAGSAADTPAYHQCQLDHNQARPETLWP